MTVADFDWARFLRHGLPSSKREAKTVHAVDLFSSAGGFGLGLQVACHRRGARLAVEAAVDVDAGALSIYGRNLPAKRTIVRPVDGLVDYAVRSARGSGGSRFAYAPEILDENLLKIAPPDILIAGPPCQGNSNLNNHTRRSDPRNELYVTTIATAIAMGARAIIVENVPGVRHSTGEVVDTARDLATGEGYGVHEVVLHGERIGLPQTRKRSFLLALLDDDAEPLAGALDEAVTTWQHDVRNVMWAIHDLVGLSPKLAIYDEAPVPTQVTADRIRYLYENDLHDLPDLQRPDCHKEGTTYGSVYGRMHRDKPAPTITTGFGTPGQGRFIHPTEQRLITPHEAARIQGFPDTYEFVDPARTTKRKELAKWIGDAVPPMMAELVCGFALDRMASLSEGFGGTILAAE